MGTDSRDDNRDEDANQAYDKKDRTNNSEDPPRDRNAFGFDTHITAFLHVGISLNPRDDSQYLAEQQAEESENKDC